jgi:hypothetical protein
MGKYTEEDAKDLVIELLHAVSQFQDNLLKAPRFVAAARRARVDTINLQKIFKKFRKVSCDVGWR